MELDVDRKLGAVVGSLDDLIEKTLEIQENVTTRANFSHWANHLRFLKVPKIDKTELGEFFNGTRTLDLTDKNDYSGETNYLAVSYCWSSFENSDEPQRCPHYSIRTTAGVRPSRTSRDVLDRSISYAVTQSIRFIWIDQECIDREDPLDLEQGIQCMDQVYLCATNSIGLLNAKIRTESTCRTFTRVLSHARDLSTRRDHSWQHSWYDAADPQSLAEVVHFLSEISADRWFYRNWTYQEASCSQGQMELLIPHRFGKQLLTTVGCPDEVSLRISELFDVVSMIRNTADQFLPQLSPGIELTSVDAMSELCVQAWDQKRRVSRPQSYEVASQMNYRDNSVVADRLAITANLCEYTKRIDHMPLSLKKSPNSLCAFAQALINGAIIPSGRSNIFASVGKPTFRWQDEKIYDFLAAPMFLPNANAHPERIEPRFADVKIRRKGLETSGWLWIVDRKVKLRKVKEKHHHLLKKLERPRNLESLTSPLGVLLADILDELEGLGLPRIASTVRACVRVGNLDPNISGFERTLDEFTTDHYYMGHWFFDLVESLLERGYLWCGRLNGEEELSSIFHCEGAATVFTGSGIAFHDIPRPWMAQNFISCEVIPRFWAADGVSELVHTMESIHGIWHGAEDASRRFMFLWDDNE